MKKLLCLSFLLSLNLYSAERILISDSKLATVKLSQETVRCSAIGYGMPELKINIKELDGWTLFDHSNIRAGDILGSPCMTAGQCDSTKGFDISTIILNNERTERIKINRQIVEIKNSTKDKDGVDVCSRFISERLQTKVTRADGSGVVDFKHERSGNYETFPLSVCKK